MPNDASSVGAVRSTTSSWRLVAVLAARFSSGYVENGFSTTVPVRDSSANDDAIWNLRLRPVGLSGGDTAGGGGGVEERLEVRLPRFAFMALRHKDPLRSN